MFDRKKIAAFVAALLLCTCGAAPSAAFADNETMPAAAADEPEPCDDEVVEHEQSEYSAKDSANDADNNLKPSFIYKATPSACI